MFASRRPPTDYLEGLALFKGCSKRELERIATVSDLVDVEAGHVLTREGRRGRECFVVREGEATVSVAGRYVARIGRDAVIGEMSVIDGRERSATVVALTPMQLIVFTRPAFQATLAEHPSVAHVVLQLLSQRVRDAQDLAFAS